MIISEFFMGCVAIPERESILREARKIYVQATANPNTINVEARYEAQRTLERAERTKDVEEMKHLAYLAHRQAQRAIVIAERKALEAERERLVQRKQHLLLQAD